MTSNNTTLSGGRGGGGQGTEGVSRPEGPPKLTVKPMSPGCAGPVGCTVHKDPPTCGQGWEILDTGGNTSFCSWLPCAHQISLTDILIDLGTSCSRSPHLTFPSGLWFLLSSTVTSAEESPERHTPAHTLLTSTSTSTIPYFLSHSLQMPLFPDHQTRRPDL